MKRNINNILYFTIVIVFSIVISSCVSNSSIVRRNENKTVPANFNSSSDTSNNSAKVNWKEFFNDPTLIALIDTALKNNQELNIVTQEIEIARNEARARKGEYLPFLYLQAGGGAEKSSKFTRNGAVEDNLDIAPNTRFPDPLSDLLLSANVSWEVDIWKKLRNARKSAVSRYLATIEGKNFMVTHLISEIASSYYELLALDNQLDIVKKNIAIQSDALDIVRLEKIASRTTELAVKRFEAEVFHTKSLQFDIQQKIIETENRINFLVGRFPTPIQRNFENFISTIPKTIQVGIPSQLLQNRTDIKQAEFMLAATKLDVKAAKANFYPSLNIRSGVGLQAFNPQYFIKAPQSLLYSIAGDLIAPLLNRNAIKATYYSSSAKQVQAIYNYERTILNAYIEVLNQVSKIGNIEKSYELKSKRVDALTQSITISNQLFKSARADYMEVLLTQRDALESKFELIETKKEQLNATINVYRALGGGWR
jgi:multidrug efflux system outer membrane protein